MKTDVVVYADWDALGLPTRAGILTAERIRRHAVFHFAYDARWLVDKNRVALDPQLQLFSGDQYKEGEGNFGIFLDSCPDRWGRLLMTRREALYAQREGRKEKKLGDIDFLLGVHDQSRMGALRFKQEENGAFLNDDDQQTAPAMTSLKELAHAASVIEKDEGFATDEYIKWLSLLISPGSSLGGARPKASVVDKNNHLWIAKFPSYQDACDIGAWEYVVHQLAMDAGIEMADCQLTKTHSRHHTFLTKRFDRTNEGKRKHFCSAMTLLGYKDGDTGQSYLELAEFLMQFGVNSTEGLAQLFRRLVFNIAVSNTDDHLRNHGFIYKGKGWCLSPAYDINPVTPAQGLHLNINETDNRLSFELALETAKFYRLTHNDAQKIIKEVKAAVSHWREQAQDAGIGRAEQQRKQAAFHV